MHIIQQGMLWLSGPTGAQALCRARPEGPAGKCFLHLVLSSVQASCRAAGVLLLGALHSPYLPLTGHAFSLLCNNSTANAQG